MVRRLLVPITSIALVLAFGGSGVAAAAGPLSCVTDPVFVIEGSTPGTDPVVTTSPTTAVKVLHVAAGTCTNAKVTLMRTSDRATRTAVLDQVDPGPRYYGEYALVQLPPGEWRVFEYLVNGESVSGGIAPPFLVRLGTTLTVAPIATVTAPQRTTITGTVKQYAGTALPGPGRLRRVEVWSHLLNNPAGEFKLAGSTYADANGKFVLSLPFTVNNLIDVVATSDKTYAAATIESRESRVRLAYSLQFRPTRWPVNTWIKIPGRTYPSARVIVMNRSLLNGNGTGESSGKTSAADGSFNLYMAPRAPGAYYLYVYMNADPRNEGGYVVEKWRVDLYRPTSLTGKATATSATIIRPNTKMSSYGTLKVSDPTTTHGYAGQRVLIQTRPHNRTTLPYTTVASAVTSSTGYYYANWLARSDVDVRVVHVSADPFTNSAYTFVRFVDVH